VTGLGLIKASARFRPRFPRRTKYKYEKVVPEWIAARAQGKESISLARSAQLNALMQRIPLRTVQHCIRNCFLGFARSNGNRAVIHRRDLSSTGCKQPSSVCLTCRRKARWLLIPLPFLVSAPVSRKSFHAVLLLCSLASQSDFHRNTPYNGGSFLPLDVTLAKAPFPFPFW
jgi:hypothetical protein